ncbi:hypothetical protein BCR35DRAFT_335802 [Leucosporidium creatinivorum]|uniref:Clp1-like protein n=1 Tax=Leucosporidium creatinivorum TaxID=106004 RepID=A0A1Y2D5F0_9BASI|nr:hypothetical protein BCR35DRAFT_335802 [Leucosporidium creatinivorum]
MSPALSIAGSVSSPSLFSAASSYSTAPSTRASTPPPQFQAQQAAPVSPPLPAAIKAATVHLPLELPAAPSPIEAVELAQLAVDEEFEGMPNGFVVSKLQGMGELGLASPFTAHSSNSDYAAHPSGTRTTFIPSLYSARRLGPASPLPPSHILAIHAPDSPRTLLVPVHGLLFASHSTALSLISSKPHLQPSFPNHPALPSDLPPPSSAPNEVHLPVVELHMPSSHAFPLLQSYIYLQSPSLLLASLLPTPPPTPKPSQPSLSALLNPTPLSLSTSLAALPGQTLLERISMVHGLWQTAVALGVSDEKLWATMRSAWGILAGALCVKERRRKEEMSERVDVE